MDSDSDLFESADEEFESENQEKYNKPSTKNTSAHHDSSSESTLKIKDISLAETKSSDEISTQIKSHKNIQDTFTAPIKNQDQISKSESDTIHSTEKIYDEGNITLETNKKSRITERKERPQRSREPKTKLGVRLGTKITNKSEINWDHFEEPDKDKLNNQKIEEKRNEFDVPPKRVTCWENESEWTPIEDEKTEETPKLYSEKSNEASEDDFWNNEADYMELPRKEKTDIMTQDSNKESEHISNETASSGWGTWGNWGVSSLLSTASLGVSTLTNSVSQGITTVLETGIGAPDPEELARIHKQKESSPEEKNAPKTDIYHQNNSQIGFRLGNLVSGVTHITKLVETTGTKVLTGGLDTLEVIGKKTMEVLQEGDPGLKKKRALFKIDQNKPVLSQILREAKEKAEEENKFYEEKHIIRKAHYETIFDDYQGLVHLEALEMLSKQCDIKLESILESYTGNALTDIQETLTQIKELCELPDEDEDNDISDIDTVRERIKNAVTELHIKITYEHFLKTWSGIDSWLQEDIANENDVHQKAIENLAELTAIAVEQFHKAAELLLVKERRSTVDEADSLVQLTIILTSVIGVVAARFSEKLNTLAISSNSDNINSLITNIFLEAANSSSYIQDAFNLMIPVLQVGAV